MIRKLIDWITGKDGAGRLKAEEASFHEWQDELERRGYCLWQWNPPKHGQWIQATRREWKDSRVWQSGKESPWLNAHGLWWRQWNGAKVEGLAYQKYWVIEKDEET